MKKAMILCACLVGGAAAVAQEPAAVQEGERLGPRGNPDEVVCVTETQIGTRLGRKRVCRTRAQWDEVHSQTRQVVERVQLNKQTSGQ